MRDKLLAQLKLKFAGVPTSLLDRVADSMAKTVTDETKIGEAISGLDNLPFSITDYASLLQSEGDRRATDAVKTHEEKLKGQFNFVPKATPTPPAPSTDPNMPEWAKIIMEQNKAMTDKLTSYETKEKQAALSSLLAKQMAEKKIPSILANGIVIEKEEDLPVIMQKIEANHTALKQELINNGVVIDNPAGGSGGGSSTLKADIESMAKTLS